MLTTHDLYDRLKQIDEVTLLEILDISAEELVERFGDRIEERWDRLQEDFQ